MKREYDVKREMLLVFRNIVVSLFKGKDVFVSGGSFLAREYLLFLERVRKVYPGLTKDDVFIMLLVRMSFSPVVTCETGIFQIAEVEVEEKTGRFRHGFKEYDNEVVGTWTC